MSSLRSEVLRMFKKLHRTSHGVFRNDSHALNAARMKINEEFRKNIDCKDTEEIGKKLKFAEEVDEELRTTIVQAKIVK
ncbi:complex III assembly factor LYRM7 [Phlebotomus papatasi]|uniref:complex III assembly factor LYRM7 n=1 Tax=Phlebotomus papatasi TaxID=29031 RepID=UPI0024843097|nr:complex III assembly factor LYRM7 [Phlebotomus papatasi]